MFETDEDKRAADRERRLSDYARPYRVGTAGLLVLAAIGFYRLQYADDAAGGGSLLGVAFFGGVALSVAWKAVEQREDLR